MHAAHPAPEIPQRDAHPEEVPKNAARLADKARANGWTVRLTFARGTSLDAYGAPGKLVDSLAVRLSKPPIRAIGIWHNGKFSAGLVSLAASRGELVLKSRQLTDLVVAQ